MQTQKLSTGLSKIKHHFSGNSAYWISKQQLILEVFWAGLYGRPLLWRYWGLVLRSWSQSRDGSLVVHDSDCWSEKEPWRPSRRPCPCFCRLGNRLREREWLGQVNVISAVETGTQTLVPRIPSRSPGPATIHKSTSISHPPTGPMLWTLLSAWLNICFLRLYDEKQVKNSIKPSLWSPGNTYSGLFL